jgi:hypothetical protein
MWRLRHGARDIMAARALDRWLGTERLLQRRRAGLVRYDSVKLEPGRGSDWPQLAMLDNLKFAGRDKKDEIVTGERGVIDFMTTAHKV